MSSLTEEFKVQIEREIAKLEKVSSLEIVPVIAVKSDSYFLFRFCLGALTYIFASIGCFFLAWMPYSISILISLTMASLCVLISYWGPAFRFLSPKGLRNLEVTEAAERAFLRNEVFRTKERTGLLIYISELEHAVYLLADRGLTTVVPEAQWRSLGIELAKEFSHTQSAKIFLKSLDEIALRFSKSFSAVENNPNELSNNVRST